MNDWKAMEQRLRVMENNPVIPTQFRHVVIDPTHNFSDETLRKLRGWFESRRRAEETKVVDIYEWRIRHRK